MVPSFNLYPRHRDRRWSNDIPSYRCNDSCRNPWNLRLGPVGKMVGTAGRARIRRSDRQTQVCIAFSAVASSARTVTSFCRRCAFVPLFKKIRLQSLGPQWRVALYTIHRTNLGVVDLAISTARTPYYRGSAIIDIVVILSQGLVSNRHGAESFSFYGRECCSISTCFS